MKHVSQRWVSAIAIWLASASLTWADPIIFPEDAVLEGVEDAEGAITISDASGSVRMGQNASASVAAAESAPGDAALPPSPLAAEQVTRPVQPMVENAVVPFDDSVGFAQTQTLNEILWRLGRINGDQYGYDGGYTNFNAFVPFGSSGNSLFFFNPRVSVTDYGFAAVNLGLGHRYYSASRNRVYGASFWYDYDDGHATDFSQLGISLENIGQYVSFRSNVSFPVGNDSYETSRTVDASSIYFAKNFIYADGTTTYESAYQSYDFEVSTPMPVMGRYGFDWGLGVYYLNSDLARDATGISARIQAQITENVWMNGIYTDDRVFDSQFSLNFEITMPNGKPRRWFRRLPVSSYLTQSVQRRYRVPVGDASRTDTYLGRDANGNAITIAYIDPDATAGGDGTIENPYASTDEYAGDLNPEQYQFIFVRRRDDGTSTNLDSGITLVDYDPNSGPLSVFNPGGTTAVYGQKLIGDIDLDPASLPTYDAYFNGVETPFQLPSETTGGTGEAPILANYNGVGNNIVNITGNGHEIFGFVFDGRASDTDSTATYSGVVTDGTTDGFYIHGNTFQNMIAGIDIASDTSTATGLDYDDWGRIEGNTFNGIDADTSLPGANTEIGARVIHTDGNLDLLIADNTIDSIQGGTDPVGIYVMADGATATINDGTTTEDRDELGILRNTITSSGTGIAIGAQNAGRILMDFNENSVTDGTDLSVTPDGDGLIVATDGSGSLINLTAFNDNTFSNNAGNGAVFQAEDESGILIGDQSYDPSDPDSVFVPPMLRNTFSGNGENGMYVNADDSDIVFQGIGDGTVANQNVFSNNSENGLDIDVENGGGFLLGAVPILDPTEEYILNPLINQSFTGNGFNGLSAQAIGTDSKVAMAIGGESGGNTFTGNATETTLVDFYAGINLAAYDGGELDTPVLNNTVTGNAGNGIQMTVSGLGASTVVPEQIFYGNTVTGNTLHGIQVTTESGAMIGDGSGEDLLFEENIINTNGQNGVLITANGNSVINANSMQNQITENGQNGYNIVVNDTAEVEFVSRSDQLQDNTLAGIRSDLSTNGDLDIDMLGANVSGNESFGFLLTAVDNATYEIVIGDTNEDANSFDANGDAGIALEVAGESSGSLTVVNTSVTNSVDGADPFFNGEGISVRMLENAILTDVTIGDADEDNVVVTGNAGSGILFSLNGTSVSENATIQQSLIQNTLISENGAHGIDVRLNGPVSFQNATVIGNTITLNTEDGIHTERVGAGTITNFQIGTGAYNPTVPNDDSNLIQGNGANGIFLQARNTNSTDTYSIAGNLINENGENGIHLRAEADADLQAEIEGNYITNNTARGIYTSSRQNTALDTVTVNFNAYNNFIDSNGQEGIQISGVHDLVQIGSTANDYPDNIITNNGSHGIGGISGGSETNIENNFIADNEGGGVVFEVLTFNNITITDNIITRNTGDDGVQLDIVGEYGALATVTDNIITFNGGDGVELITTTGGDLQAVVDGNVIEDNDARGIAVFNRGGTWTTSTNMDVTISDNSVRRNGEEGVYVVNTADADQDTDAASTVAMEADGDINAQIFMNITIDGNEIFDNGYDSSFDATGLVFRVGTAGGGQSYSWDDDGGFASDGMAGVIATVTDNLLGGNFGSDVYFESFVSTDNPADTEGTWTDQNTEVRDPSNDVFTISQWEADALARLDLTFSGNVMEQIDATNDGAFYNNDESEFKSRGIVTVSSDTTVDGAPNFPLIPDDNGPFLSGTRARNAQRQASRANLPPTIAAGANFQFAGMGESTFRVNSDVNSVNTWVGLQPSIFQFVTPFPGTPATTGITGELDFGWGELP